MEDEETTGDSKIELETITILLTWYAKFFG